MSQSILDQNLTALTGELSTLGASPYRSKQIFKWIYKKNTYEFEKMTDLSLGFRNQLSENFNLQKPEIIKCHRSEDGTRKLLFALHDGKVVESVLIPSLGDDNRKRMTLCVSSQVGCALGCAFCNTATQGLERNLTTSEIIGQILGALDLNREEFLSGVFPYQENLTNVVFMGMGEPLQNLEPFMNALRIMVDDFGLGFSKRKITVSTAGLVPAIEAFNKRAENEIRVNLAVSLNAPNDELRSKIMPVNKAFPLDRLMKTLRDFKLSPNRRITFEYILMKDLNDHQDLVFEIAALLKGIPSKVNLIPFNEYPGSEFKRPSDKKVSEFQKGLLDLGITTTVRMSKGLDIFAACGMLKTKHQTTES